MFIFRSQTIWLVVVGNRYFLSPLFASVVARIFWFSSRFFAFSFVEDASSNFFIFFSSHFEVVPFHVENFVWQGSCLYHDGGCSYRGCSNPVGSCFVSVSRRGVWYMFLSISGVGHLCQWIVGFCLGDFEFRIWPCFFLLHALIILLLLAGAVNEHKMGKKL